MIKSIAGAMAVIGYALVVITGLLVVVTPGVKPIVAFFMLGTALHQIFSLVALMLERSEQRKEVEELMAQIMAQEQTAKVSALRPVDRE